MSPATEPPAQHCPACEASAPRQLDSTYTMVWYFRCTTCFHVWAVPKDGSPIRHVTVRPAKPPADV